MDVDKAIYAIFCSISGLVILFELFQKRIRFFKMAHLVGPVNMKF